MIRGLFVFSSVVVFSAVFWQVLLRDVLYITLGIGRMIQTLDEFPYTCRKIEDERLTGCEDLWLDDEARILYAACATTQGRLAWNQAVDKLNVSARRPGGTEFLAISIDQHLSNGSFPVNPITLSDYTSNSGDSSVDLLGFDGEIVSQSTVHFYLVNQRPPVDAQGKHIDAHKIGANATIEVFEHPRGGSHMRHLRTIWDPERVYTPNNVAAIGGGEFVVTNDHSPTLNWRKPLDFFIGGGGVSHCDLSGNCSAITPPRTFKMPNGLARGADGLIYVPSSISGTVSVYSIDRNSSSSLSSNVNFTLLDTIPIGMPLDNFALDLNGDLWIPGFPNGVEAVKWTADPVGLRSPVTVWRLKKLTGEEGYEVKKMLEDGEAKVLNAATTVRHDAKTGRLFLGACFNEFVVCEPELSDIYMPTRRQAEKHVR